MDTFKSRKLMSKALTIALAVVFIYGIHVVRTVLNLPILRGDPVDWRNLPSLPPFPRHSPKPLPLPNRTHPLEPHHTDDESIDRLYKALGIITAFSENHYKEALGLIGTVQKTMPDKVLIVYDLGLQPNTLRKVKRLCNVEVRRFRFEDYMPHVHDLHMYAWKVIIINMTLHEFGAIFWADSSIRFRDSLRLLLPYTTRHHGYMTHFHSFHPNGIQDTPRGHIYFFTHPKMFAALGIRRAQYYYSVNATPHASANRQLIVNNPYIQKKLIKPLLQCALKPTCICPPGAKLGRHRFDASALSLIMFKNMRFEWTPANNDNKIFDEVIVIRRTVIDWYTAKSCYPIK